MPNPVHNSGSHLLDWRNPALIVGLYSLFVVALFYDTVSTMVYTWSSTETYTHGFMILPISVWLVWRQRESLQGGVGQPQPQVLILTALGALMWLLGTLVEVNVLQQLGLVSILTTGVWSLLGTPLTRHIAFPLAFLFLAVPMGKGLIPPLMEVTADSTEALVRASGVPIYREGMYLFLPTGNWSVVEACSGIRYLIASYTLGLVYAWLTYQSLWRRIAFVLASIIVPIAANSIRAYGIVMIGHLSNMELATGVDHLLYGWVFFGIVMLLLFWVGGFWQEPMLSDTDGFQLHRKAGKSTSVFKFRTSVLLTLLVTALGPTLVFTLQRDTGSSLSMFVHVPVAQGEWEAVEDPGWGWRPAQEGGDRVLEQYYQHDGQIVGLLIWQYFKQQPGLELVQSSRPWVTDSQVWRVKSEQGSVPGSQFIAKLDEAQLQSGSEQFLVWTTYRVDGRYTTSPYIAKFLEAKQLLLTGSREGSRLFVVTQSEDDATIPRAYLRQFLDRHQTGIESVLDLEKSDAEASP